MVMQFNSSVILFDGAGKIAMDAACCCDIVCSACDEGFNIMPNEITVTLPDFVDDQCFSCADYGVDWVIPSNGGCTYRIVFSSEEDPCGISNNTQIRVSITGNNVKVYLGISSYFWQVFWERDYTGLDMKCSDWVNEEIPWDHGDFGPFSLCASQDPPLPAFITF